MSSLTENKCRFLAAIRLRRILAVEEAVSVPKIVAVPLSWRDAKPLLENLDGPAAPKSWQGGLPLKYRLGGTAVRAHVKADMDTSIQPNYVVEARIRGSESPEEWIVLGNHPAWVFGGVDPASGTASMMEFSRALGELKGQGLRPRRTLVICSWDGEEYGLIGSAEWGEEFAEELKQRMVAYLNVDSAVSGPNFRPVAVASLAPLVVEASRSLQAPSGKSLYEEWKESRRREQRPGHEVSDAMLVDTRVGSGWDHTVFLNHMGRPTIGLSFDGPYGVYHSMYDDFYWTNLFGDPGYRYHTLMAQLWGVLALRLANAEILPFDFAFYAERIGEFVRELEKRSHLKDRPAEAGGLDLRPLRERIGEFLAAGREMNQTVAQLLAAGHPPAGVARTLNEALMKAEGNWLTPEGIPGRPWFQHLVYGTRYTYAHSELPGLTEAVEAGKWDAAKQQARLVE